MGSERAIDPNLPEGFDRIEVLDAHAGGEPLRIVTGGLPEIEGETMLDRRRDLRERHDDLRTAIVYEPRGHRDMYGAVLTDPVTPGADFGVLFLHNEGYSTMCGHGIVALTTALVETGVLDGPEVTYDTPAGPVSARTTVEGGRVRRVAFENVAAFAYALDRTVEVPSIGTVEYDVAYGGAFYAYVDAAAAGVELAPGDVDRLVERGRAIKRAVADDLPIEHPEDDDLGYLYGTIFTGPPRGDADSRNVCVFADGQVDRSPTGTGVSGRLALRHARGEQAVGDPEFAVESVVDTTFAGRVVGETTVGDHEAVVPEVAGSAHLTGVSEFVRDPEDPLGEGFLLR